MKNKKIGILLVMILMLFMPKVKAWYNGDGGFTTNPGGGGSCSSDPNVMCNYSNAGKFYLQARLYYISSKGEWEQLGRTLYITQNNANSYNHLKDFIGGTRVGGESGSNSIYVMNDERYNSISGTADNKYQQASEALRAYLGDSDEKIGQLTNENLKDFLFHLYPNYETDLTKDTKNANPAAGGDMSKAAKYGYRIIIEPALTYVLGNKTGFVISSKGVANRKQGLNSSWNAKYANVEWSYLCNNPITKAYAIGCGGQYVDYAPQSQFLYTSFADVGISQGGSEYCYNISEKEFADPKNGCGYNIIDVGKYIRRCYSRTVVGEEGGMTCTNIDKNNETNFTEKYKETSCDKATKEETTNTKYGKLSNKETENCNAYCIESAFASFPGGISEDSELGKEIRPGGYFAWPARFGTSGMKLHMSMKYKCTIISKKEKTCTDDEIEKLITEVNNTFSAVKMSVKLKGGTNAAIDENLVVDVESSSMGQSKDKKGNTTFVLTRSAYFKIRETKNRYADRITGKAYDSSGKNRIDRHEGVISLKKSDPIEDTYYLTLSSGENDVQLGTGNQFGKKITNYTCPYHLQPTSCYCTFGLEDKVSLQYLVDDGMTCEEAHAYTEKEENRHICESYYCKAQTKISSENIEVGTKIDITKCVKEMMTKKGYSSVKAAKDICIAKEVRCRPRYCTDTTTNKKYDITECVYKKLKNQDVDITTDEGVKKLDEYTTECSKEIKECNRTDCSCLDDVSNCMKTEGLTERACREKYNCPESLVCPELEDKCYWKNGIWVPMNDCLKQGYSWSYCEKELCPPDDFCEDQEKGCYYCNTEDGKKVDITNCVTQKNKAGMKFAEAKAACAAEKKECNPGVTGICYYDCEWKTVTEGHKTYYRKYCSVTKGSKDKELCDSIDLGFCDKSNKCQTIKYRTIDLNNPFPGKSGSGVTADFSNNGMMGRLPNYNWNSVETVKNKILSARGVKGNKIYNLKPLYTLVLTPENIKAIKEYDKEEEYSNFNLSCKSEDGSTACVSNSFLRNNTYVTIDYSKSECGNISSVDDFNKCYKDRIN